MQTSDNGQRNLCLGAQEAGRQACGAGGGTERVDTDLVDLRIPTTGSLLLDKESGKLYKFDPNRFVNPSN